MEVEEDDFPTFEVVIEEESMKGSIYIEGQTVYFPKENLVVNASGIAAISSPGQKIDRVKINTKELKELEELGFGSTAIVRRAVYRENGKEYVLAVKSIDAVQPDGRKQLLNDLRQNLKGGYCAQVVEFYSCFFRDGMVKLVIEFMDMGPLKKIITLVNEKRLVLTEGEIAIIMQKILRGLHHIHNSRHSIHRDIKPENILMNSKGEIKITDFGVSKCIEHSTGKSLVGSIIYMSPERLNIENIENECSYSYKSDIWSVGLVMYELATGQKNPYSELHGGKINVFKTSMKVLNSPAPELPPNLFSPHMYHFFRLCVSKNENDRASAEILLQHPWITQKKEQNLLSLVDRVRALL